MGFSMIVECEHVDWINPAYCRAARDPSELHIKGVNFVTS
jgi:hypothetical protein